MTDLTEYKKKWILDNIQMCREHFSTNNTDLIVPYRKENNTSLYNLSSYSTPMSSIIRLDISYTDWLKVDKIGKFNFDIADVLNSD